LVSGALCCPQCAVLVARAPGLLRLPAYARLAALTAPMLARQVHRCIDLNPLQFFRVAPAAGARGDEGGAAAAPAVRKGMLKVPSLLFDIEARACAEPALGRTCMRKGGLGLESAAAGEAAVAGASARLPGRTGAGGCAYGHPVD